MEKTITDPQLKLTTGLHLTNGKIKTQMSVSAVGKDMSIIWLIYATKIHNKPLSMPYLLKIKLTFSSDDDPIDWAYKSIQTVINNNLGTIDQTIVDLITDLHNELNTVANKFESFVDVFTKAKNALIIGALTVVGIAWLMNGGLANMSSSTPSPSFHTAGLLGALDTITAKSTNTVA